MRAMTLAVAAAVLLMAACGGDEAAVTTDAVSMLDNEFEPSTFTAASDTIAVSNDGQALHSFTVQDGGIDQDLQPGERATIDLSGLDPGTYDLTCTFHPEMTGQVTVE